MKVRYSLKEHSALTNVQQNSFGSLSMYHKAFCYSAIRTKLVVLGDLRIITLEHILSFYHKYKPFGQLNLNIFLIGCFRMK